LSYRTVVFSASIKATFILSCVSTNSLIFVVLDNQAPSEAEAECAALCINDKVLLAKKKAFLFPLLHSMPHPPNMVSILQVFAVASEDMDSLTFGAPRFLRHLMDPSSKKIPVMEFDVAKVCIFVMCSIITLMLHICHHFFVVGFGGA
jgi:hypothetical protein